VRSPTVGDWVATEAALEELRVSIASRVEDAGPAGVDLAAFDERERTVLAAMDDLDTEGGRVRPVDAVDPYADHPALAALKAGGFTPPAVEGVSRDDVRELARRGLIVQRDGVVFHADTVDAAAVEAARLLEANPEGFTVAQFRDATGASRKYALPLASELDARGITRRRDDLRIAGPRLPEP
jgi:selenocysteine-specific elongation factor